MLSPKIAATTINGRDTMHKKRNYKESSDISSIETKIIPRLALVIPGLSRIS